MIFTSIRAAENQHNMTNVLFRTTGMSSAFMSLLRGSFDFLLPCSADASGVCHLSQTNGGDSSELERCLGRPLLGTSFNDMLAGPSERARFAAYVQNAVRQADRPQTLSSIAWQVLVEQFGYSQSHRPPVAQVLNIKLEQWTGNGQECGIEDEEGAPATASLSAVV